METNMTGRANMNAVAASEETKKIAEIQGKMILARQFPRNMVATLTIIENECREQKLAETAIYEYPRGDSVVKGASIRLVECVARHYGNIMSGVEEISSTPSTATVRAFAWDLETNYSDEKIFDVEMVRSTKKGSYPLTDPRDRYEHLANQAARRKRACIQAIIPQYIINRAMEVCEETLADAMKQDGIEQTREKMLSAFTSLADWITPEMLGDVCGRDFEKLGSRDFVKLRNLYNSIKDGFVKPEAVFGKEDASKPKTEETEELDKLNAELGFVDITDTTPNGTNKG